MAARSAGFGYAHDVAFAGLELGIARRRVGRDGVDKIVDLGLAAPISVEAP